MKKLIVCVVSKAFSETLSHSQWHDRESITYLLRLSDTVMFECATRNVNEWHLVIIMCQALCIHEVILLPQQSPVIGITLPFCRFENRGSEKLLSSLTLGSTTRKCQAPNSHPGVPDSKTCAFCRRPSPLLFGIPVFRCTVVSEGSCPNLKLTGSHKRPAVSL